MDQHTLERAGNFTAGPVLTAHDILENVNARKAYGTTN